MAPEISLRPATMDEYDFALNLYLESTKRLLVALGQWDEKRVVARFREDFKPGLARIIRMAGTDIGWMQISNSPEALHLDQLHLIASHRGHGVGTQLIQALQQRARDEGKPIGLNVIRGNPAIALYRRLGFHVVDEDDEKLRMRWDGVESA